MVSGNIPLISTKIMAAGNYPAAFLFTFSNTTFSSHKASI